MAIPSWTHPHVVYSHLAGYLLYCDYSSQLVVELHYASVVCTGWMLELHYTSGYVRVGCWSLNLRGLGVVDIEFTPAILVAQAIGPYMGSLYLCLLQGKLVGLLARRENCLSSHSTGSPVHILKC